METNLDALHGQMLDLNAKIKELQDQAAKTSQEVFKSSLKQFFDAVPEIQSIVWRQYTPYFNDGDSCEFSVHDANFYSSPDGTDEDDEEDGWDAYNPFDKPSDYVYRNAKDENNRYRSEYQAQIDKYDARVAQVGAERIDQIQRAIQDVRNLFRTINDEYFMMMFGDHVRIVATKDGFQVDEFDHD